MRCSKWGAAAHTSNHKAKLQGMVNIFLFLASLRAYPPGLLFQYLHRKPSACCLENCTLIHTSQQHTSVVSSSIQTCTSSFSLQCQIQFWAESWSLNPPDCTEWGLLLTMTWEMSLCFNVILCLHLYIKCFNMTKDHITWPCFTDSAYSFFEAQHIQEIKQKPGLFDCSHYLNIAAVQLVSLSTIWYIKTRFLICCLLLFEQHRSRFRLVCHFPEYWLERTDCSFPPNRFIAFKFQLMHALLSVCIHLTPTIFTGYLVSSSTGVFEQPWLKMFNFSEQAARAKLWCSNRWYLEYKCDFYIVAHP